MGAAAVVLGLFALHRRHRIVGAVVGVVVGMTVLDLQRPAPLGATAVVAGIAIVPMLTSGFRRSSASTRQVVAVATAIGALCGVAASGAAAYFAYSERAAIESAVADTRNAVGIASSQDTGAATAAFDTAATSFDDLDASAQAWWLTPARFVPIVGPNLGLARTAIASGSDLNRAAGGLTSSIDQSALRSPAGGVDLAVLASMKAPVAEASEQILSTRSALETSDSPWLVAPLRDGFDELLVELDEAGATAETARMAVERAPQILGAAGPQRYLMLLGNPAESRDIGGHIGNWAEVVADNGVLTIAQVGQPYDIASPATSPALSLTPGAYPQSLVELRPQNFPQNWGGSADFPTVARLARELFGQALPGDELAGVIYADPEAFAALLNFTGPEQVPGTNIMLTPENATSFFTTDQFTVFENESDGNTAVSSLIETVMSRFGRIQLPNPQRLAEVLGPVVRSGRLQFVSFDSADSPLLERLGLLGAVERPGSGDLLAVLTRNANPSKIDVYLRRSVRYDVDWDPVTGAVDARLTVSLTNDAPSGGLPAVVGGGVPGLAPGTNRTMVSILSPWSAESVSLDGTPSTFGVQQELRGVRRTSVMVDLAPGQTRVLELEMEGNAAPRGPYVLQWIGQPTAVAGATDIAITPSGTVAGTGVAPFSTSFRADEDSLIRVDDTPA